MDKHYVTKLTEFSVMPACVVCGWGFPHCPEIDHGEYDVYFHWYSELTSYECSCRCGSAICPDCGEKIALYTGRYELTYEITTQKKFMFKDKIVSRRVGERFIRGTLREIEEREKLQPVLEIQLSVGE